MEDSRIEVLRTELTQLLKKQADFLESRSFGGARDTELRAYELRQDIIREICDQLGIPMKDSSHYAAAVFAKHAAP